MSHMDDPVCVSPCFALIFPVDPRRADDDSALPPGWTRLEDPFTHAVFYWHVKTHTRTTERPRAGAPVPTTPTPAEVLLDFASSPIQYQRIAGWLLSMRTSCIPPHSLLALCFGDLFVLFAKRSWCVAALCSVFFRVFLLDPPTTVLPTPFHGR